MPLRCLFIGLLLCIINSTTQAQTVAATYNDGDIPTSFSAFDSSCNGNSLLLKLTLPPGDDYTITGIDISYSMSAIGAGQMSQQRSQVKCVNTAAVEASVFSGVGNSAGTYNYNRTGISIANGTYAGNSILQFEMHAWRTVEGTAGCNTLVNRVNAGSWTITAHYITGTIGKVGVNTNSPKATLEVNGKLQLGDDVLAPQAGAIRWNSSTKDFEGYNGTVWLSLTNKEVPGGSWGTVTTLQNVASVSSDGATDDNFGSSVSIDGDYAIVGAPNKTVGLNNYQGRAYIFFRSGTQWSQQAILNASDASFTDLFGASVSIAGDYAVVGAPYKQIGAADNQGKVYVFMRNGTAWTQQAILTAIDGSAGDFFGISVAISGNYIIVGANGKTVGANTSQGKAYVFLRSGTTWTQQTILTAADAAAGDVFGTSVGISGDYAIVSASGKTVSGKVNQGKVYIFNRSGINWLQQAALTSSDGAANDYFGYSNSISGNYAIVGAFYKNIGGKLHQGKAYIYGRTNGNVWTELATLEDVQGMANDYYGQSVSISGDYAVVGSQYKYFMSNYHQGSAFVYKRNGVLWNQQIALSSSDGAPADFFGSAVCMAGTEIIVAATNKAIGANTGQGKVYFYYR